MMMNTESLKKQIKKKFATYSRFCKLAGLDRYIFQTEFLSKKTVSVKYYRGIAKLLKNTKDNSLITEVKLKRMRTAIDKLGGVKEFCADRKFAENTVFQILSGKGDYKRATPTTEALLEELGIK